MAVPCYCFPKSWEEIRNQLPYPAEYATLGFHPNQAAKLGNIDSPTRHQFKELSKLPHVLAIGEIGLDYDRAGTMPGNPHYDLELANKRIRAQETLLHFVLPIARDSGKPIVIHCRERRGYKPPFAYQHLIKILQYHRIPRQRPIYLHCFDGNKTWDSAFDQVYYGFNVMQLPSPHPDPRPSRCHPGMKVVMREVPLGKFMIETDSPYLRSKKRQKAAFSIPTHVVDIGEHIAAIRFITKEEVFEATTLACRRFHKVPEEGNLAGEYEAVPVEGAAAKPEHWT